ncbi:MAG: DUF2124 family protein [Candidatus Methanomethyliales bacterium]|nr:DUF2124 family protein [Candidatus Methanomethylicales archaeon]
METMVEKGLVGLSRCFRTAVVKSNRSGRLLFVGTPYTCLPFAEFLTYSIRDLPLRPHFSPNGETDKIVELVDRKGYGYALGESFVGESFSIVVLLGGLAMPKSQVDPSDLKRKLSSVSALDCVIGVCFQGVMDKPEWRDTFKFKYFINAEISKVSLFEF